MKEINYANCMIRKCEQCRYYEYCFRYKPKEECYSKIDVMKYLINEHRKGSEADGK